MITGTSQADCAILMVPAATGEVSCLCTLTAKLELRQGEQLC